MKPIAVANWKANKTIEELKQWFSEVKPQLEELNNVEIVVCPSFVSLAPAKELFSNTNLKLGAQTVSSKPRGAFTGEVSAQLLTGLVSHCIVGHSERRKYFGENSEQVAQKLEALISVNIVPILCVSDISQLDDYLSSSQIFKENSDKIIFVYEPPSAISGGGDYRPEEVGTVRENVAAIRSKVSGDIKVLYGGSVNKEIIGEFLSAGKIDGALIGKASLEPSELVAISKVLASTVV